MTHQGVARDTASVYFRPSITTTDILVYIETILYTGLSSSNLKVYYGYTAIEHGFALTGLNTTDLPSRAAPS